MGQDQSASKEEQAALLHQQTELKKVEGFQVVRLLPHSPAHQAGLVPYFDIITALDHHALREQEEPHFRFFKGYLSDHRNQQICFTVYNLKLRGFREVLITPSDSWGGGGLLGCSVEWARADDCVQRCWHIVAILADSPASYCPDLHEERDYIIGMQQPEEQLVAMLKGEDDFHSRLSMWQELQRTALERKARFPDEPVDIPHSLLLLIYDLEENCVKEVLVDMGTRPGTPLGISVATGLLHIIPTAVPSSTSGADGSGGGDVPDLANLPYMNRFYVPRDLNFETNYPSEQQQQHQQEQQQESPTKENGGQLGTPGQQPGVPPPPPAPPAPSQQQQHQKQEGPQDPAVVPLHNPFANGAVPLANPFAAGLQAHQQQQQHQQHQQQEDGESYEIRSEEYFNQQHVPAPQGPHVASSSSPPQAAQPAPPPSPPGHPHPHQYQYQQQYPEQRQAPTPPQQAPPVPLHQPQHQPQQQQQQQEQPARFAFPPVPPPLDFPSFPRPPRT